MAFSKEQRTGTTRSLDSKTMAMNTIDEFIYNYYEIDDL